MNFNKFATTVWCSKLAGFVDAGARGVMVMAQHHGPWHMVLPRSTSWSLAWCFLAQPEVKPLSHTTVETESLMDVFLSVVSSEDLFLKICGFYWRTNFQDHLCWTIKEEKRSNQDEEHSSILQAVFWVPMLGARAFHDRLQVDIEPRWLPDLLFFRFNSTRFFYLKPDDSHSARVEKVNVIISAVFWCPHFSYGTLDLSLDLT